MEKETTSGSKVGQCSVLVTGAAGFLGQHVVKLLQTHSKHVTEIRVLDVVPYVNKLGHDETKPVKHFTGSITDVDLALEACDGVDCVMHIASIVDIQMFPNRKLLEEVNVKGTENLLKVSRRQNVRRFIYCSSAHVVVGYHDIIDATEDTSTTPDSFIMADYSSTKNEAEKIVLQANGPDMTTLSIRPVAMYGEGDRLTVAMPIISALKTNCYFDFDPDYVREEHAYAGNVAWMFVRAEMTLFETAASNLKTENNIGGNAFFACDDTPLQSLTEFMKPIFEACNLKRFPLKISPWFIIFVLYIILGIYTVLKLFFDVNMIVGPNVIYIHTIINSFKYDKAKKLLGYVPLFSVDDSMKRSIEYYKSLCSVKKIE